MNRNAEMHIADTILNRINIKNRSVILMDLSLDFNSMDFYSPRSYIGGLTAVMILSIAAAIALAVFFLPKSRKDTYSGIWKKLYEFLHFSKYYIPGLMRFVYLFIFCYAVISGIYSMFAINFFVGLGIMIGTPLIARLATEGLLILYSIREELIKIREKLDP